MTCDRSPRLSRRSWRNMFTRGSSIDLGLNRAVESPLRSGGSEGILPIVQVGEPVLRQPTRRYNGQLSKSTLTKLVETMRTTMVEAPGVGLPPRKWFGARPGGGRRPYQRRPDDPREISNFRSTQSSTRRISRSVRKRSFYEGCLSFEGYQAVRKRWRISPHGGRIWTARGMRSICTAGLPAFSS